MSWIYLTPGLHLKCHLVCMPETFLLLINLTSGFCVNICCHLGENLITPQRDKAGATQAHSWELKFVDIVYERALSHLPSPVTPDTGVKARGRKQEGEGCQLTASLQNRRCPASKAPVGGFSQALRKSSSILSSWGESHSNKIKKKRRETWDDLPQKKTNIHNSFKKSYIWRYTTFTQS